MPRDNVLRSSVESLLADFASQLEALVRQSALDQVRSAFGDLAVPAPVKRGRPRKAGGKPGRPARGGRRASVDMDAMQDLLLVHVKTNPGQRGDQIAAALGSDVGRIRLPMKKLIAARKVKTKGQRRGMMYFPAGGGGGAARPAKATTIKRGKKKAKGARKSKRATKARRAKRGAKAMTKIVPAITTKQAA